jgi:hypothetical protein
MISIAIALVLIIGVNQVFKIAAQTVGAGQAFSAITRDERVAHFSVYTDVHNITTVNQPALLISSQCQIAFRDQQDFVSEPSGQAKTLTINKVGIPVSQVLLGARNYRVDTLGFFASGDVYQRQTASAGYFVSPTTATSAYVWYGHLALPNNAQITATAAANTPWYGTPTGKGDLFDPGQTTGLSGTAGATNDNNLYAAQWILGRVAMLMVPGAATNPTPPAADTYFIPYTSPTNPLAYGVLANDGTSPIQSSRYDLVAASATAIANTLNTPALRSGMLFRSTGSPTTVFRYEANPFPVKPLNAQNMAGVAPIFLNHCCNVIVEYAGDYLTQQPQYLPNSTTLNPQWGQVITSAGNGGAQGDGTVDFVVDESNDPTATNGVGGTNPALWVARTRWYGFPRDANSDGAIDLVHDVVPLRDVLQASVTLGGASLSAATVPWETFSASPAFPVPTNSGSTPFNYAAATATVPTGAKYTCSWGSESSWPLATGISSGLPRMLRITISLDDPAGRLAAPQTYEYVIDLGAQH